MRDDNSQQQLEHEEQQWKEMQEEIERYAPFTEDFRKFVASHEEQFNDQK